MPRYELERPMTSSISASGLTGLPAQPRDHLPDETSADIADAGRLKTSPGVQKTGLFGGTVGRPDESGVKNTDAGGVLSLPVLDAPLQSISGDDVADMMRFVNGKMQDGRLKAVIGDLKATQIKADQNLAKRLEKILEWIGKCKE